MNYSASAGAFPTVATVIGFTPDNQSGPLVATLACPPAVVADVLDQVTPLGHPNQQPKMDAAQIVSSAGHTIDPSDPVTKAVVDNIVGNLPSKKPQLKLSCDVCNIQVISQNIMDDHLNGVKHARKVKSLELMKQMKNMISDYSNGYLNLKNNTYTCQPCNVIVNSIQQLQVHCQGTKHKSKLTSDNGSVMNGEIQKAIDTANPPLPAAAKAPFGLYEQLIISSGDAMSNRFYCSTCNVRVNSDTQLEQHKQSKKHTGKLGGVVNERAVPYSKPQRKIFVKEGWNPGTTYSPGIGGSLRCNVCNVSANSVIQLQQHNISKKHKDKLELPVVNRQMETMQQPTQHTCYQPSLLKKPWVASQNDMNSYSYSPPIGNNGGSTNSGYNINMYQKWTFQRSQPSGYGRY